MKKEEIEYLEIEVKTSIMPEIKAHIPIFLGWILKAIFPKLELRLIELITKIVDNILNRNK